MGKRGQQVPGTAQVASSSRASPSPVAHPRQPACLPAALACSPCSRFPEVSPLHCSKALLTSRLQSLGSKNRCHLGVETDGKRAPPISILAHSWLAWQLPSWQWAGQAPVAPAWSSTSPSGRGGWQRGVWAPGVAPAHLCLPHPKPLSRVCPVLAGPGPHAGPSVTGTLDRSGACLVCVSCSFSWQHPPQGPGKGLGS